MNDKKSYLIFVAKIISGYIAFIFILYSVADSYRHSNNKSIFVVMGILSIAFIILVAKDISLKIKKANEYEKLTKDYYIVRLPYREKSIYLFDSFDDRSIFLTYLMDFCTTREQLEEESIEAIKEMINSKYDEYRSSDEYKQAQKEAREFESTFRQHIDELDCVSSNVEYSFRQWYEDHVGEFPDK